MRPCTNSQQKQAKCREPLALETGLGFGIFEAQIINMILSNFKPLVFIPINASINKFNPT
jgi:hypothetical protein